MLHCQRGKDVFTLPETNSSHLKMGGWKTSFILGWPICHCYVSFGECNWLFKVLNLETHPSTFEQVKSQNNIQNVWHLPGKYRKMESTILLGNCDWFQGKSWWKYKKQLMASRYEISDTINLLKLLRNCHGIPCWRLWSRSHHSQNSGDRQGCTPGPTYPVMGNPYISPI